jgi:type I restriction enzyme S subunit
MSDVLIPKEWERTYLGDVVSYGKTEKVGPGEVDASTWVLELEDIEKDSSRLLQMLDASERQFKSTKNRFKAGDVLYGKLRPYLNKVVVAPKSGICTTEIIPVDGGANLDNHYLFHWLKSTEFLTYVTKVGYGVNMPRLGTKDGVTAPFVLAPLAEQREIARRLDEHLAQVDTLKTRLDAIPNILKRFRQSTLAAAVSGKLTEQWREENFCDESAKELKKRWLTERVLAFDKLQKELVQQGIIKRARKYKPPVAPDLDTGKDAFDYFPPEWKVVSVSEFSECLDSQRIPVKKEHRQSAEGIYPYFGANGEVDRVDEFLFDDDLVLVTEDETFYGRVKPIAYRYSGKCWVNNHAHVLRAPTKVANDYLCFSLMYYQIIPWLSGTTGRAKLTQAALNSLPIGLPPEKEQTEIVRRVEELFSFADLVEQRVKEAQARVNHLTQSILAKAFRGELTSEWRTANPDLITGKNSAAALLARIQSERAKLTPKKKT